MRVQTLWLAKTGGSKTGPVPTSSIVGDTGEREDLTAACGNCALRPQPGSPTLCYAQRGRTGMGARRMIAAAKREPLRYMLAAALANRRWAAKIVRLGAIGNPSAAGVEAVIEQAKTIRAAGLIPIGFDHEALSGNIDELRGILMASCDDYDQAREALRRGWVPAVIVPRETKGPIVGDGQGNRYRVCPEQLAHDDPNAKPIQCNECRLCTPDHPIWKRADLSGVALRETGPRRLAVV